jgi:hypothetical protein
MVAAAIAAALSASWVGTRTSPELEVLSVRPERLDDRRARRWRQYHRRRRARTASSSSTPDRRLRLQRLAAIKRISSAPIRYLIDTNADRITLAAMRRLPKAGQSILMTRSIALPENFLGGGASILASSRCSPG